jgi:hypothetical protein
LDRSHAIGSVLSDSHDRYTTSTTKTAVCVHRTDSQIDEYCSIEGDGDAGREHPDR